MRSRARILAAAETLADDSPHVFTITDLLRLSGVSRSTFYAHFAGLDDVCSSLLENALDAIAKNDAEARSHGADPVMVTLQGHTLVLQHLATHRSFFAGLLGSSDRAHVREHFTQRLASLLESSMRALPEHPSARIMQTAALYTAGGFTAVIASWLSDPHSRSLDDLASTLSDLSPTWLRAGDSAAQKG